MNIFFLTSSIGHIELANNNYLALPDAKMSVRNEIQSREDGSSEKKHENRSKLEARMEISTTTRMHRQHPKCRRVRKKTPPRIRSIDFNKTPSKHKCTRRSEKTYPNLGKIRGGGTPTPTYIFNTKALPLFT